MRSFGDLSRSVLVLEGVGMVLLVLAYLSINDYVRLPGMLASQQIAVGMIFLGVALMVPAAACLVWRVAQGFSPLLRDRQPPKKTPTADKNDHGSQE
ncbi:MULTISPECIES: YbjC family protein [unclassified Serratia (in: enterobacteria)]|uniref:YbjC family protein n=1 Tax=unclassified Serratia (in: enterobacteria) TaxID=2647522 RepID=UPI00068E8A78|nr:MULTISPECIES: YbjC family protein [unclassified Serratia (in: enterobacteria)]